ncbi:MAG TPA: putative lipid II flippase FtsW [bacterium]|nr:putative lipid II flippase FtsW [bacterium]
MQRERVLLFIIMIVLLCVGIVMIYSTSAIFADVRYGSNYYFLKRQLLWLALGLAGFFTFSQIDYHRFRGLSRVGIVVSLVLLAAVFIPHVGRGAGGAKRWISLGFFSFQPSEIAKYATIIFLADYLDRKQSTIGLFFKGFIPPCMVLGAVLVMIVAQPDLGTVIAIALVSLILFFIGRVRIAHILTMILGSLPALYVLLFRVEWRRKRLLAFLDPWKDPQGSGFQIIQSFIALGSGGLFGVGLGQSRQKLFYLPEAHTDFIFSIIGEELGLVGTLAVVVLFILFLYLGARIVLRAADYFGQLLSAGIVSMITLQTIVNVSVVTGSIPTKGLPLPYISFGGSSLLLIMTATGVLMNVAKQAGKKVESNPFAKHKNRLVDLG